MNKIDLNNDWQLKEEPLSCGKEMAGYVLSCKDGWYNKISLPADVHMPLIDAGVIKEPVLADYSFESEWIEQRSWWFKKEFEVEDIEKPYYRLVLESLDVHADVFLNGVYLGHQPSAFYPFKCDVKEYLVKGKNTLLIRLSSGLEYVSESDLAQVNLKMGTDQGDKRGDNRRVFIRKPAYVYGWDWGPRVASVAIAKGAYIECFDGVALTKSAVETLEIGETARICVNLELEGLNPLETVDADIKAEILYEDKVQAVGVLEDKLLCSGLNYISFEFDIENPQLWWPNGMGEQALYQLRVSVKYNNAEIVFPETNFGIRTIEHSLKRIDEKNRKFEFIVNGVSIFSKGANWVPADSIYARVSAEKYEKLIKEAAEANFNMLRIWGGGLYERDEFYDACDRYGILIWQDFMFACASYPGHIEDFYDLVCKELDYQTKRLGGRACLAILCGNNEIQCNPQLFETFGKEIFNIAAPEYVRKNCPWIPYWNSSPYPKPSYPFVGDDHFWDYINLDIPQKIEPKGYDAVPDKFISEYGYVGATVKESVEQYFDGNPVEMNSEIWNHHKNPHEKDAVLAGIKKHYTDKEVGLDEYILYSGLVQSLMYGYSLESFRSKEYCGGGLMWMYNDCWGEVGWTIIDYYLRRKISFYGVKRALEPVKLIMREEDGTVKIFGINETNKPVSFNMKYGYVSFDGSCNDFDLTAVTLKPQSRGEIFSLKLGEHSTKDGVYYAKSDSYIDSAILRVCDFKELNVCPAKVRIVDEIDDGKNKIIEVTSETYAHGVYVEAVADMHLSDNYFDLLPGERKRIIIEGGAGKTFKVKAIN